MANNIQPITSLTRPDIERLIADRRNFHQHPELAYNEHLTARVVADRLRTSGYEVKIGIGRTGVVGFLRAANQAPEAVSETAPSGGKPVTQPPRTLLYRADMDALPIREENDVEYRSENDGVMHACGHDAHVAIALGVAKQLAAERDQLNGNQYHCRYCNAAGHGSNIRRRDPPANPRDARTSDSRRVRIDGSELQARLYQAILAAREQRGDVRLGRWVRG